MSEGPIRRTGDEASLVMSKPERVRANSLSNRNLISLVDTPQADDH
jgi:hypothetical protein